MDKSGVFSVDFLLSVMIILLIFSGFVNIISDRINLVDENAKLSQSRILIEKISSSLNKAYCGGHGQKINLNLPQKIGNSTYLIKINGSSTYIELEGKIGKTNHFTMLIIDSDLKIENTVIMRPGKSYVIENVPLESKTAVAITEI